MRPLVIVGDTLLDIDVEGESERLCPEAPVPIVDVDAERCRPGGAGMAAMLAASTGHRVVLVTALGEDEPARRLRELFADVVEVVPLRLRGDTIVKKRVRAAGQTMLRLDTGDGRADEDAPTAAAERALATAGAILVADYGHGVAGLRRLRRALGEAASRIPVVWDPHPNGAEPIPGTGLVTPNQPEASTFASRYFAATPSGEASPVNTGLAERLRERWRSHAVAITLGANGAALAADGDIRHVPVPPDVQGPVGRTDPCGAGDHFAVSATAALLRGAETPRAVRSAVAAASGFVAAGGAAGLFHRPPRTVQGRDRTTAAPDGDGRWSMAAEAVLSAAMGDGADDPPSGPDPFTVAERTHHERGTLVATGGCFDLLHPGHLRLLRRARAHGDALVVCLNSDDSVARLKGPGRPILPASDRTRMLLAYDFVDAVAVFDESTPDSLLERLRPDVWAKGGDYTEDRLPEAGTVRRNGGRIVLIPMADGYSTTKLVAAAGRP